MKKVLTLILVLSMVLGSIGAVFAAPALEDVIDTVYEDAVVRLASLGILEGYPDGTFKPDNTITRAEYAAAVIRAKGLEYAALASVGATSFSDVPATHWAAGYINVAAKAGFINGMGDGTYAPEAPITYEQAVTLVTRALGYEPAAQSKGGYPYGYLIVAAENGLLEKVRGTQGAPAPRGLVAQLLDNALEIPLMIQIGYGDQTRWVVSGTSDTDEKTILDDMGFESFEGTVTRVDDKKNRITVTEGRDSIILKVEKDFDFYFAEQLEVKAWYDKDDNLILYKVLEDAIYGATEGGSKIKIDGTKYSVIRGAYLELDGKDDVEAGNFEADYAKVVLDEYGDIRWAKGYTLPEFLVVAEVDGNEVLDYDEYGVKLKDFTIVKNGKTISIDDIEELDILLYNKKQEFALVYNDSVIGKIDRVYNDDSFRLDGKNYDIVGDAKYLDDKNFGELDKDILDNMEEEGEEVEVFLNPGGKVVLVIGSRGDKTKGFFYGYVHLAKIYPKARTGENVLALDVRNEEGKKVSYDIAKDKNADNKYAKLVVANASDLEGTVIKITVDRNDEVTKLETLASKGVSEIKLNKTYAGDYRLQDSTLIFHGTKKDKVVKLEDAGFAKVTDAVVYADKDKAVAIVGDVEDDTDKITDLVTKVREIKSGETEFTLFNKDRYTTKADDKYNVYKDYKDEVVTLEIGKKSGLVEGAELADGSGVLTVQSRDRNTVKAGDITYRLASGAKLYDLTNLKDIKEMRPLDLEVGDKIKVYYDEGSEIYVQVVVKLKDDAGDEQTKVDGVVTYINLAADGTGNMIVDGKTPYALDNKTRVVDADDNILFLGGIDVSNGTTALANADLQDAQVDVTAKDGVATTIKIVKTADELATAAAKAFKEKYADVLALTVGTVGINNEARVSAAKVAYDDLSAAAKDKLVNSEGQLLLNLQGKIDTLKADAEDAPKIEAGKLFIAEGTDKISSLFITSLVLTDNVQKPVNAQAIQTALEQKLIYLQTMELAVADSEGRDDIDTIKTYRLADMKFNSQNIKVSADGKRVEITGPVFSEATFKVAKGAKSANYNTPFKITLYDVSAEPNPTGSINNADKLAVIEISADGTAKVVAY